MIAIFGLALLSLYVPHSSAQSTPVIGYMANATANLERLAIFRKGLADSGYVEGKNIIIEYRLAKMDSEYSELMAELIARSVKVVVAANAPAAVAAGKATRTIPIVMAAVDDPVGLGLVKSLEHPGTNVTGTTNYSPHLIGERVRLLKTLASAATKVAMLTNGSNANNPA